MRSTAERPTQPVTYESALAWARGFATDADALHEVVHAGFNADETSGGYAFLEPGGTLYVASRNGSVMFSRADVDPAPAIEQFWAEQRHRDRPIDRSHLGPMQQAALDAALTDCGSVREHLDRCGRSDVNPADLDFAERLLIHIKTWAREPTEAAVLRVFASDDSMLDAPDGEIRTHACPICGLPALGGPRYPRAVCNACSTRAADSTGRPIAGYNTSLSGGFVACYLNDDGTAGEVCAEVTACGECWIDGRPCSIGEARFGGVVIQATYCRHHVTASRSCCSICKIGAGFASSARLYKVNGRVLSVPRSIVTL